MKCLFSSILLLSALCSFAQTNNCNPPTAQVDLDINNVRARILNGGDMWWDLSNSKYEIPKGSGKHSIFSGAIWVGGIDAGNQLKIAAQTYRQSGIDFWAGPVNTVTGNTELPACNLYDRHWKITRQEVMDFINTGIPTLDIVTYPGNGNPFFNHAQFLAPFYDANGDGIYNTADGDYPKYDFTGTNCNDVLLGDQTIWWVFNDVGNIHTQTDGVSIGLEVHAMAYAYASFDEAINNTTFYQYKLINRSSSTLDSTYFGSYVDVDLGNYLDDYIGCDVGLSLGYAYNADANDDGPEGYGLNPPAVGSIILEGPVGYNGNVLKMTNFIDGSYGWWWSSPTPGDYYDKLRTIWPDGTPMTFGGNGYGGTTIAKYMYPDSSDPANPTLWTEITAGSLPGDRVFLQSSGTFQMQPGQVQIINSAVVWARENSGGPIASLHKLKAAASTVQTYFDNCFFAVGINENELLNGIKLFPNPSLSGRFKLKNIPPGCEVLIYNTEGKSMVNKTINSHFYEWHNKGGNGIYFVKIKYKGAEKTLKWVCMEGL